LKERFEIEDEHTIVAYGTDPVTGVFLSVSDKRLAVDSNASDEVNLVAQQIGVQDGSGNYFDLHTGKQGFGFQVSNAVMRVLLARYRVPEDKINFVFQEASLMDPNCRACKFESAKKCAKCKTVQYCGRACQVKDWPIHKYVCESLPFPEKKPSSSPAVYCFFMPENGDKIQVIQVETERTLDPVTKKYYDKPKLEEFLGRDLEEYVPRATKRKDAVYSINLIIMRKNLEFEMDNSVTNKLAKKLTNNKMSYDWKGSLVAMKFVDTDKNKPNELLNFIGIEIKDLKNMVELLSGVLIGDNEHGRSSFKIY
jgi:hypothetical protein